MTFMVFFPLWLSNNAHFDDNIMFGSEHTDLFGLTSVSSINNNTKKAFTRALQSE